MIVNCVAYEEGRRLCNIDRGEIGDYRSRSNCFVWVALHDPDAEELSTFQDIFELHELAVEDALVGEQRPKVEEYGDALFVVTQVISVGRHDKTTSVTSFILHIRMSNRDTSKTVHAIDKVAK